MYQMSRLTTQRGAITHDDRLDALSIAVNYWVEQMAQDAEEQMRFRKEQAVTDALERFKEAYYKQSGKHTETRWF